MPARAGTPGLRVAPFGQAPHRSSLRPGRRSPFGIFVLALLWVLPAAAAEKPLMHAVRSMVPVPIAAALARGRVVPAAQPDSPAQSCTAAIDATQSGSVLPRRLLHSIAVVESGRIDAASGRVAPWAWTINVEGTGFFYPTKQEAITAVETFHAAGKTSIDVGCMQINLYHHPDAFGSLDQAFDPQANTRYAALFLQQLFHRTGNWETAVADYHSHTVGMSEEYRRRVLALWAPELPATPPPPPSAPAPAQPDGGYTREFAARLAQDAQAHAQRIAEQRFPSHAAREP